MGEMGVLKICHMIYKEGIIKFHLDYGSSFSCIFFTRGKESWCCYQMPPEQYLKKIKNLFLYPLKDDPHCSYVEAAHSRY